MHIRQLFRAKLIVFLCLAGLMLGACGGGTSGSTWFNLPSVTLRIGDDGDSVRVLGLHVGALSSFGVKDMMDSLAAGGVGTLEVRLGYNGIHIYVDGAELPYVYWDEASASALAGVLTHAGMAQMDMESLFALVRHIGVGVKIAGMNGQGTPRWSGETSYTPMEAPAALIGPLHLSGLAFDSTGALSVDGVDLGTLGVPPVLDAGTLQLLSNMGVETLQVTTTPNTLALTMNGAALPGLAYDEDSLAAGLDFARILLADDPATLELVETYLPRLPALALTLDISFTGTPVGSTQLLPLHIDVAEDGNVSVLGLPLGAGLLPADAMDIIQKAGIQRLDVQVSGQQVTLASNGQVLPSIALASSGAELVGSLVGDSAMVPGALELVEILTASEPLALTLTLPGNTVETSPLASGPAFAAPDLGGLTTPMLRLPVTLDGNRIATIAGMDAGALGLGDMALPDSVLSPLAGVSELSIHTRANNMEIRTDGDTALVLAYDVAAMQAVLDLLPALVSGLEQQAGLLNLVSASLLPAIVDSEADIVIRLN